MLIFSEDLGVCMQRERTKERERERERENVAANNGFSAAQLAGGVLGYLQELPPLREAHGVVAILQFGVLCQLVTHKCHLLIHILEEAIFCVLGE